MKKVATFIASLLLFLTGTSGVLAAIAGDVNLDNSVDIIDIGIVIDYYALNPAGYPRADINIDGRIDIIDLGIIIDNYNSRGTTPTNWEMGSIRYLPEISADLTTFVKSLPHPKDNLYNPLSSTRQNAVDSFFSILLQSSSQLKTNHNVDWCGVMSRASDAGYLLYRFFDSTTQRWFIFAKDNTGSEQAYLFINPEAKRNIVLELPHAGYEINTDLEGAKLLTSASAYILLINGADRCSSAQIAACGGSSNACGTNRMSDVAHDTQNSFHRFHRMLSDRNRSTKFVQLHGMGGGASDVAEVSDGSTNGVDLQSIALTFASGIRKNVPNPASIHSCQDQGSPPTGLCGTTNIQGRYTNSSSSDECRSSTSLSSGRFIHLEQSQTIRDDNSSDGYSWRNVLDGLLTAWPECNLGSSSNDCSLGSQQQKPSGCSCGSICN